MNLGKTILLVEDNRDDVFIFKKALKNGQINNPVNVVTNGQEAVDYLSGSNQYSDREKYPLPCVIFLDLKMPYFDGFEVLAWIRAQPSLQSISAVVLSGSDEPHDHQRAYALGTRSCLVKPPRPEEIRRFIVSMGGHGDQVDQP